MRSLRTTVISALVLAHASLVGCATPSEIDFDPDEYDPIPRLHALDWGRVIPAESWDLWEVRAAGFATPDSVVGSGGSLTRAELDPAVRQAFESVSPTEGFAAGCLPAYCYKYLVAVRGEEVVLVRSADALREFIAPVTTTEEAILAVAARDYLSWDEGEETGVRPVVGEGWDVVVLELSSVCVPVQTDRVRFRVSSSGNARERAREVWHRLDNACV